MKMSDLDTVPLMEPYFPSVEDLLPYFKKIQDNKYYTNFGPLVNELEDRLANSLDIHRDQITTVANATLGLELVLTALNLPQGSFILIPSFTFVATVTSILRVGHVPVVCDVDLKTWCLTAEIAEEVCSQRRIDAIIAVTSLGMPYDLSKWGGIQKKLNIPVVIDAAAAYGNQQVNSVDNISLVFSLHATKSLPAAEGGIVISTVDGLAKKVRELSNFGINLDSKSILKIGELASVGTNAKMSEYHAAICLASLNNWSEIRKKRKLIYHKLIQEIQSETFDLLSWQKGPDGIEIEVPSVLCVKFPDEEARSSLEELLGKNKIMSRRWYQPLISNMSVLKDKIQCCNVENSLILEKTILGLPFFPTMRVEHIIRIKSVFREVYKQLKYNGKI